MCAQPRHRLDDVRTSPIRALHSLTHAQADQVEAALAQRPLSWVAERHEGYDGHLSLMLSQGEAADERTLVVHRDAQGLRLDVTRGDRWDRVGCWPDMESLLARVLEAAQG